MKRIQIFENGINAVVDIENNERAELVYLSTDIFKNITDTWFCGLNSEICLSADATADISVPFIKCLNYNNFKDINTDHGRKLIVSYTDEKNEIEVSSGISFFKGMRVIKVSAEINNCNTNNWTLSITEPLFERARTLTEQQKNRCAEMLNMDKQPAFVCCYENVSNNEAALCIMPERAEMPEKLGCREKLSSDEWLIAFGSDIENALTELKKYSIKFCKKKRRK